MKSQLPSLVRRGSSALVLSAVAVAAAGTISGGCTKIEVPSGVGLDAGDNGNGSGNGNGNDGPLPGMVSIRGFIKNSQGAPVAAAEVTVGDAMSASSDNNGLFDVDAAPNPEDVVLQISAPDHAPQIVKIPIKTGVTSYGVPVVMQRIQTLAIGPDDLQANIFIGDGEANVIFDEPMGQSATLRFVSPPPEDGPGELRFVDGDENEALQTAGIFWLELLDEDGNLVGMPGGVVDMDVGGPDDIEDAGDWQGFTMDAEKGQWKDPQMAAAGVAPQLTFVLPPYGYWAASRPYPTACVRGTVSTSNMSDGGDSCSGAMISAVGPQGVASKDSIGADGSFCVMGAAATATVLHIGEYQANAAMPAEPGNCDDLPSCNDIGDLEIPDGCQLVESLDPPSFAIGEACTATAQCGAGGECFNGYCVGTGAMRVSLAFSLATDLDLHLLTPSGEEIFWNNEVAGGGQLDLDQCATPVVCDAVPHAENIVFAEPAASGQYEVWVLNYDGTQGGDFTIEVSGQVEQTFKGTVAAEAQTESEHFTFTVGAGGDAGAADGG
ncbi:MAG TPA: hypothetical protein VHO25_05980 [Polyangiaceae bacterium]|nr:hypothetical protein [Polyangiaceae bacterium]